MTPAEQDAFVEAYANNVADVHPTKVAAFIERYANGEDIDYSSDYTSIMDALCMWNSAVKWQMGQTQHHHECPAIDGFGCHCEELEA